MSKETHDELSDLLDSFQDDDTMEKRSRISHGRRKENPEPKKTRLFRT